MKKKSDENQERILVPIHVARLYLEAKNFATFQKSWSEEGTLQNLWKRKYDLQLSLEHFNHPSLISNTSQENGRKIVMKSDFWESHLPE